MDVPGFEKDLESLLRNRSATGGVLKASGDQGLSQRPFGMSLAFIGLLFAVLASGCQSSDLLGTERELTSQVYGMYGMDSGKRTVSDFLSLLLISVSSNDKFRIATHSGSYQDASYHWQCLVLQYESWCILRLTR